MMKRIVLSILCVISALSGFSQYKGVEIEEVDNGGLVDGKTYRVYVQLANDSDQVFMVFGDSLHPMNIQSSKPFFQSPLGGLTSKSISRILSKENPQVQFDSWISIGAEDNYNNNTEVLKIDDQFESKGAAITAKDGAWFCLPGSVKAYAGVSRKVLVMQLTTKGKIGGTFSIMGRKADGSNFIEHNIQFSSR